MAANRDTPRDTQSLQEQLLALCQKDVVNFVHDEMLALLKPPAIKVDITDEAGMTPLMHAAYKGNLKACETLLKHGADVNCNQHEHFYTALMFGAMSGSVPVVSLLMEAGAKPHATNKQGRTAAQTAAFIGHYTCAAAINNFFPRESVAYYSKPQGLEVVAKLPSSIVTEVQMALMTTNLHPIKMMQFFFENLFLCQHHTRVSTTLEAIASKTASEMNEIMSLKAYYIYYILRTFIGEGTEVYVKKCLTQQVPEGVYRERDVYLRQFLKEYPYIHNTVWKEMAATASRNPLGGPPSVLSLLHSAVRGHVGFSEGEEGEKEECASCGTVAGDLKKCLACKQVSYCNVACQKMAWEQGSHKKLCKLYRKQQSSLSKDQGCATPTASTSGTQETSAQNVES